MSFCVDNKCSGRRCTAVNGADGNSAPTCGMTIPEELVDYIVPIVTGWPEPVIGGNDGIE